MCNRFLTIQHMKVVMDADCLIKLTKAQLKEKVCTHMRVVIPASVKREVVDRGKAHPDAWVVAENLRTGLLATCGAPARRGQAGEEAALNLFRKGEYEAVCSDDRRFVRRLRALGVPYLTPAVLVLVLVEKGHMTLKEGRSALGELAPFVSEAERTVAELKLATFVGGGK